MAKKELTAEEIYKRNQKRAKIFKIISPISFWVFLALALLCLIFAVESSFGNVAEIRSLLNSDKYNGEQLESNYNYLVDKYGEWVIGKAGGGFSITFVDVGNALFSGVMIANAILSVIFVLLACLLGKWIFPKLASQLLVDNQDMVNLTILRDRKGDSNVRKR